MSLRVWFGSSESRFKAHHVHNETFARLPTPNGRLRDFQRPIAPRTASVSEYLLFIRRLVKMLAVVCLVSSAFQFRPLPESVVVVYIYTTDF